MLKNDKAHQLEKMRKEVEGEFLNRYQEVHEKQKEIARYIIDKGIEMELQIPKKPIQSQDMAQIAISIVGFRNIL